MAKTPERDRPGFKPLLDPELAEAVKASAHQIWLAGMGAFAKAQTEGGKVFEKLVKEGTGLQKKTQTLAEESLGTVGAKATAMAEEVSAQAASSWDKLESIFEARTAKALARLGVPTAAELAALQARVEALQRQVDALSRAERPAAARKSTPAAKKAATKATTKKPVSRSAATTTPAAPRRAPAARKKTAE